LSAVCIGRVAETHASVDERARRVAENEALFREVNERIRDLNDVFGALTGDFTVVCECGDGSCVEQLRIEPREYERVRGDPAQFIVVRGHEILDLEDVLQTGPGYAVVRKKAGAPERLAEEAEPRS
jgi:hypothetical protein